MPDGLEPSQLSSLVLQDVFSVSIFRLPTQLPQWMPPGAWRTTCASCTTRPTGPAQVRCTIAGRSNARHTFKQAWMGVARFSLGTASSHNTVPDGCRHGYVAQSGIPAVPHQLHGCAARPIHATVQGLTSTVSDGGQW